MIAATKMAEFVSYRTTVVMIQLRTAHTESTISIRKRTVIIRSKIFLVVNLGVGEVHCIPLFNFHGHGLTMSDSGAQWPTVAHSD